MPAISRHTFDDSDVFFIMASFLTMPAIADGIIDRADPDINTAPGLTFRKRAYSLDLWIRTRPAGLFLSYV
jgi:hypothetical protein